MVNREHRLSANLLDSRATRGAAAQAVSASPGSVGTERLHVDMVLHTVDDGTGRAGEPLEAHPPVHHQGHRHDLARMEREYPGAIAPGPGDTLVGRRAAERIAWGRGVQETRPACA